MTKLSAFIHDVTLAVQIRMQEAVAQHALDGNEKPLLFFSGETHHDGPQYRFDYQPKFYDKLDRAESIDQIFKLLDDAREDVSKFDEESPAIGIAVQHIALINQAVAKFGKENIVMSFEATLEAHMQNKTNAELYDRDRSTIQTVEEARAYAKAVFSIENEPAAMATLHAVRLGLQTNASDPERYNKSDDYAATRYQGERDAINGITLANGTRPTALVHIGGNLHLPDSLNHPDIIDFNILVSFASLGSNEVDRDVMLQLVPDLHALSEPTSNDGVTFINLDGVGSISSDLRKSLPELISQNVFSLTGVFSDQAAQYIEGARPGVSVLPAP